MRVKINPILISTLLLLIIFGCTKSETIPIENKETSPKSFYEIENITDGGYFTRDWVSVHNKHNIDTSKYEKYQLFDFCALKGFGVIEKEPYVLIRDSAEFKIVRRSDDLYNPYFFQNMGDYWYNYKSFYMELRFGATLNGPYAAEVHRFVKDGKLFEYYVDIYDSSRDDTNPYHTRSPKFRMFTNIYKCHVVSVFPNEDYDTREYEMTYSANMFNTLQNKYKILSKQKGQYKKYMVDNYDMFIKYAEPYILEYINTPNSNKPDSVLYSPLGAIDDDCTKPRAYGNHYALIRDTHEAWRAWRRHDSIEGV